MKQNKSRCVYFHIYNMYRWLFKSRVLVLAFLIAPYALCAQSPSYAGEWAGQVFVKEESRTKNLSMQIANEQVLLLNDMYKRKGGSGKITSSNLVRDCQLQHEWQRKRLFGEEVETFILIPIHEDTLQVQWLRKCIINQPRSDDTWTVSGTGLLIRKHDALAVKAKQ